MGSISAQFGLGFWPKSHLRFSDFDKKQRIWNLKSILGVSTIGLALPWFDLGCSTTMQNREQPATNPPPPENEPKIHVLLYQPRIVGFSEIWRWIIAISVDESGGMVKIHFLSNPRCGRRHICAINEILTLSHAAQWLMPNYITDGSLKLTQFAPRITVSRFRRQVTLRRAEAITVSQKTSPTFLAVTRESIVEFS